MRRLLLKTQRFEVVEVTTPGGETGVIRQFVDHPGAVVVMPLLDDGRICLIRNFRVAVGKTLVELPAGTLEPGETPAATAARELSEETGFRAAKIDPLPPFYMSPGILNERMHPFVASGLTAGPPRREAGEEIENLLVSRDEAIAMVERGDIADAKSIATLLLAARKW